jgi:hypothetical protein
MPVPVSDTLMTTRHLGRLINNINTPMPIEWTIDTLKELTETKIPAIQLAITVAMTASNDALSDMSKLMYPRTEATSAISGLSDRHMGLLI